jgi:outer membrane lipoprotein-sorting protein
MQVLFAWFCAAGLLWIGSSISILGAQSKEENELQQILSRIDETAKSFRTFTAKFSQKKYTEVLKEFDTPDTGEFYYAFAKDGSALMRHEVTNPGKRILTINGKTATLYRPVIKQAQVADLTKGRKELVEYFALGIGQRSAKLKEKFTISYQGSESINGIPCSVLVLKPKDTKETARLTSITAWLNKADAICVQYKFQEPTGDYQVISFSERKLNIKIPNSKFEQKLPRDVERQKI